MRVDDIFGVSKLSMYPIVIERILFMEERVYFTISVLTADL